MMHRTGESRPVEAMSVEFDLETQLRSSIDAECTDMHARDEPSCGARSVVSVKAG